MDKLKSICAALIFWIGLPTFASPIPGQNFDRALIFIFENTDYKDALAQPFFGSLAKHGALFSKFYAEVHPSQGNYIALTSGSTHNVHGDGNVNLSVFNMTDLLDAKGLTWKVYLEDYPGGCFKGGSYGGYARKHNPFISYVNVQSNSQRCQNLVSADQFELDVANGTLPNYSFYVPNVKNDGHDTGVRYADQWYKKKMSNFISDKDLMKRTIVITTFDESGGGSSKNQIYTSIVGADVRPQIVYLDSVNHFSLLKMFEDNWNLGNLNESDVDANAIPNIWN
jgi:hypothetical protein